MRKPILAIPVMLVVMGLGVYVGLQARAPKFTPHTIDYLLTEYDEDGTATTGLLTRTVDSKGNWHHVQTMPDGSKKEGRGRMTRLRKTDQATRQDQVLGRSVSVRMTKRDDSSLEEFYNVEIQDDLRHILRDANGRVISTMEAIAVR